jgi:AraC family transcriptional regulator of adaptative response / DNA-3-methyladenine glycosylase II
MADIAFAAGFQSVRAFNHALRETFRETPTELRRRRRRRLPDADGIVLRLPFRPPYDWDSLIAFLRPRATPGVEVVEIDAYRRTAMIDGKPAVIEVSPVAGERYLQLHIESGSHHGLIRVVERVRRLFDLGADPLAVSETLRRSRLLAPLVAARPGLRVPGAWDPFELAVRAVLGQQVTVAGASTLAGRLVERFGTPIDTGVDGLTQLFPSPGALAGADLASIGLPGARAETLRALSRAVADGSLVLASPQGLDDAVARLRAVPGIGDWTAHYITMRAFGEPDAFPASDLGLRRALATNGALPTEAQIVREAEAWRPWRAYAAMYLWTLTGERQEMTA